ncbi:MAG: type III-A CRISPR-associated RAMP protein Csm5 [Spirochaetota bacterium]|nr:type III-A CRISPR-associated RAMP protein Csm5 [Spirochaetota bacterium]
MTRYKLSVIPITGIHIGTGDEISPLEYTIVSEENKDIFRRFQPEKILAGFSEGQKNRLDKLIDNNKIQEIMALFHQHVTEENCLYECDISQDEAMEYYDKINDLRNQLIISEMYRDRGHFQPVIPGSSLKGAIRTAIINQLSPSGKQYGQRDEYYLVKDSLKKDNAFNDPFRSVRITDCPVKGQKIQSIQRFINFKENRNNGQDFTDKMRMVMEVIRGKLMGGDSSAEGYLDIDERLNRIQSEIKKWRPSPVKIDLKMIIHACNQFFMKNMEAEHRKFYENSMYKRLSDISHTMINWTKEKIQKKNCCLIRLGRFSHVENVTEEKYRNPKTKKGYGNTRTLMNKEFPTGWAILEMEE